MMHRLIGMVVIVIPHHLLRRLPEERLQIGNDGLSPTHQLYHTGNIMGDEPSLLVRVALHRFIILFQSSFLWPRIPAAILSAGPEPMHRIIEDILIAF